MTVRVAEKFKKWLRDESGATAIEYGLIAAAMGAAIIPAIGSLSSGAGELYGIVSDLFSHPSVSF
jgi:pilus assembly protein Flp/PilA